MGDYDYDNYDDDDDDYDDDEDPFDLIDNLGFDMGDPSDFEGLRQAIWGEMAARQAAAADTPEASPKPGPADTSDAAVKQDAKKDLPTEDGTGLGLDLDEDEVEKLEKLMLKLKATRELGEGMPEEQRKKLAKKAVMEVMKDL